MNDKINRVLADRPQAFTTAEQKQARDNIGAQETISYSYSGGTITAIDGSAVGQLGAWTTVYHDSNLSGSGTSGTPLGLSDNVVIWNSGTNYSANISPSSLSIAAPYQDPLLSASLGELYMSGHAGNLSSPYTASLYLTGLRLTGYRDDDEYSGTANYSLDGLAMNSPSASATFTPNGITAVDSADNKVFLSKTGVEIRVPFGGTSVATSKYGHYAVAYEVVLPGDNSESCYYGIGGIHGCGSFGDFMYTDAWCSAKRYEGTADSGNSITVDIGHATTGSVVRYPEIVMGTPSASSTIYMSSISSWDNKLDSINVGYGMSGDGKATPLGVTGCSGVFIGLHSDYYYELNNYDLTFSSYDKDNSQVEYKTVFNEFGMRLSASRDEKTVTMQYDGFRMEANDSSLTASLDHERLRMMNSGGYADLTKSSIDAIGAVYNWATSQGMAPIN